MSPWFPFGREDSTDPEGEDEAHELLHETHRSLAFAVLLNQLEVRDLPKIQILDLGPPVGPNIEFFSRFSCRLHIEDLHRTLNSFDYFSPEDGFSYETVFSYLLPFEDQRFDLILAWDLLNYLEEREAAHLLQHLSRFCRVGTLFFCLVATERHIPENPFRFRIVDEEHLEYQKRSTVLRTSPRYEQMDVVRIMPDFRIMNSFFLRNGFKEYLMARK